MTENTIQIKTQVHTIVMLVGPSGAGKTTFAKNVLIPGLRKPFDKEKNFAPNVQYISSDDIRKDILGNDFNKMDEVMTESSTQAFEVLFTKLNAVTTYPINAEFVVLDTTGLSEKFRNDVLEIADNNNYNVDVVVFDYKKVDEYQKNFSHDINKGVETGGRLIAKHMKRLKTEVLKTLRKGTYKNIFKIKHKDFMVESFNDYDNDYQVDANPIYQVSAWDYTKYTDRILQKKYEWITIGDVHGCYEEMTTLIKKYGFEIDADGIIIDTEQTLKFGLIFAGDLVDKSSNEDIEKTIRFIHKNKALMGDRMQLILGNHEEMVWKWVTNHKDLVHTPERLDQKVKYYNTSILLEEKPEVKELFLELFAQMKGWVKTIGTDKRSFIVTHAPCEVKYLEKMDGKSLHKQYKCASRTKNPDKSNDDLTPYLKEEAVKNQPIHIFGHMGQSSVRTFKNKVCIDAGCVYGGKLIGYTLGYGNKPFIQSVPSLKPSPTGKNDYGSNLFEDVAAERKEVDINSLSEFNQKRLDYLMRNGIGYVGGTISPAPKDEESGAFESLKSGLDYYKGKVDSVVLQPKYMGSRAQMYLNRDVSKCYATSRNGYKIKEDLGTVFEAQLEIQKEFMDKHGIEELDMDGELMPWASLGRGLIESQFVVIDKAVESEIAFLAENGFDDALLELQASYTNSGFAEDKNKMNKKELSKKFGHAYQTFKNVQFEIDRFQLNEVHQKAWEIYHEQVEIYGADDIIHYKPFRVLKATDKDGNVVELDDTPTKFGEINADEIMVVDFLDPDYLSKAQDWYEELTTDKKMEGCVVKPNVVWDDLWYAPFLKVRNPNYLHIIYGYDMNFPKKFDKLFRQKNISRKLRASIAEYKLGEQMLKEEIGSKELKQTLANFMFENEKEVGIDPRL